MAKKVSKSKSRDYQNVVVVVILLMLLMVIVYLVRERALWWKLPQYTPTQSAPVSRNTDEVMQAEPEIRDESHLEEKLDEIDSLMVEDINKELLEVEAESRDF